MLLNRFLKCRFSLRTVFVLMLGISIGYALNLQTLQIIMGPANEARMSSLPTYRIEPPDILQIDATGSFSDAFPSISGQHLVAPDGTVNLGAFGRVNVAGKTLNETQGAIKQTVAKHIKSAQVFVDVFAYNSKVYYIIEQNFGQGDSVVRAPITGNETALDAIAQIGGLKAPGSVQMWISRPATNGSAKLLRIEWEDIARGNSMSTNYQMMPGDRLFVSRKSMPSAAN